MIYSSTRLYLLPKACRKCLYLNRQSTVVMLPMSPTILAYTAKHHGRILVSRAQIYGDSVPIRLTDPGKTLRLVIHMDHSNLYKSSPAVKKWLAGVLRDYNVDFWICLGRRHVFLATDNLNMQIVFSQTRNYGDTPDCSNCWSGGETPTASHGDV